MEKNIEKNSRKNSGINLKKGKEEKENKEGKETKNESKKYTAKMVHNRDTIIKLAITQYNCFEFKKKILRVVIAIGLIVYGMYADQTMVTPMVCLILGCILIANINLRPRVRGSKIAEQLEGKFPRSSYSFTNQGFTDEEDGDIIPYSRLIRLVEDREYLYLYVSKESAYMVNKATVSGVDGVDGLEALISRRTALKWTRPGNLLTFSIKDLVDRNGSGGYKGTRLPGG